MSRVLSNLMPYEDTVSGTTTIIFPIKAKTLSIYNKSSNKQLSIKFNDSEDYFVLEPTEIIEFPVLSVRNLILNGNIVEYKVVALG